MRSALQKNDIEKAIECFHEGSREKYRTTFERLGSTRLPTIAAELGDPVDGQVGGTAAIYRLYREDGGRRYSFDLKLMLDEKCLWKIVSY